MKEWMIPAGIILLFAAAMGDGIYNDWRFSQRCASAGGVPTTYSTACIKPGSVINIPR